MKAAYIGVQPYFIGIVFEAPFFVCVCLFRFLSSHGNSTIDIGPCVHFRWKWNMHMIHYMSLTHK